MPEDPTIDRWHMARALELALRGQGRVEPNPLVGSVIVADGEVVGEGFHERFGGPHAEIAALAAAGRRAAGATLYVTLEPCCHFGKTPPCTDAILRAGVRRVVAAMADPFPAVSGGGLAALRQAGLEVECGILEAEARRLNAPYLKLVSTGRPWLIGKWAMTLDGKIATARGESQWITGPAAREIVHRLRGRMDGILIGSGTALADDPSLTARPPGPRVATRIVVDSQARLPPTSQLARTARAFPVLVAVGDEAPLERCAALTAAGCEVLQYPGGRSERLVALLNELGSRRLTNVLVEGGSGLLGSLVDAGQLDEVHAFIAPKIVGGQAALSPVGGEGIGSLAAALQLEEVEIQPCEGDVYVRGRIKPV